MNFVAIDVETANSAVSSICQIGLAKYINGTLTDSYCTLVNPQGDFDAFNMGIHGITAEQVADAPFMIEIIDDVLAFIDDNVVVSYTLFDQRALRECLTRYHLSNPHWPWVDATILVRSTFKQFAQKGYNLANVCQLLDYEFEHHDALADAKACGFVMISILNNNGKSIQDYINFSHPKRSYKRGKRSAPANSQSMAQSSSSFKADKKPYPNANSSVSAMQGKTTGHYAGLNICFTGNLTISREQIIQIAADSGFNVKAGASKKLDYLIVGTPDLAVLKEGDKSSKQRKVETLIEAGIDIQILQEQEFLQLIHSQSDKRD